MLEINFINNSIRGQASAGEIRKQGLISASVNFKEEDTDE